MAKKKQKPLSFLQRAKLGAKFAFGYDAAKNTRYRAQRGLQGVRSEEIELSKWKRDQVISALLDFKRNNPIVNSISRLRKADVVGRGVLPQPITGDDDLDKELEMRWMDFCAAPEVTGQMDMREVQQQLCDALLFYGDSGLIMGPQQFQFIDGSRITNPQGDSTTSESSEFQNGVQIANDGRPVNYWIGNRVNGTVRDITPTRAEDFYHFFKRTTPTQYRGIPELASVLNTLQDCNEYDKIEMIAAKTAAVMSVFIANENPVDFAEAMRLSGTGQDEDQPDLEQIEVGSFQYGKQGDVPHVISTNGRPNVDGIQWVSYLLRKVGSAVGIPLEFLMMEIGGSSFSASQGVVLQYQQTVESYQSDLIRVMNRLYRRWVTQLVANGEIQADISTAMRVRWQRPAFRWINRAAQVKADMEYFRAGAMSLDDITAPFGYTAEEVLQRKAQNIQRAKQIAEQSGIDDWRELINPFQTSISGSYGEVIGGEVDNPTNI